MQYLAHAGEVHESGGEGVWHTLTSEWYVALPVYVLVLIVLTAAAYLVSHKSKSAAITVLMAVLLIGGVSLYSASPVVSILSLAAGFALALGTMVVGVGGGRRQHKKN